jgi:uncharacterized protein (TIGR01777 family)
MKTILITGGTGLVGSHLIPKLLNKGFTVKVLSRSEQKSDTDNLTYHKWDIKNNFIDKEALKNTDFIIHLAGAGIADSKWTASRKKVLINSRVDSLNLLYSTLKKSTLKPAKLISTSGVGYYGAVTNEVIYKETDKAEKDFISQICIEWEAAANKFSALDIPVLIPRVGVVLSEKGGALEKMKTPAKFNFGSPLGTGKQYMPWIHIEDLCNIYLKGIEDESFVGTYNAVADEHINNKGFSKQLAKSMGKAFFAPNVPSFMLKLLFGEMSKIILEGSRVSNMNLLKSGFKFKFPKIEEALNDLT